MLGRWRGFLAVVVSEKYITTSAFLPIKTGALPPLSLAASNRFSQFVKHPQLYEMGSLYILQFILKAEVLSKNGILNILLVYYGNFALSIASFETAHTQSAVSD